MENRYKKSVSRYEIFEGTHLLFSLLYKRNSKRRASEFYDYPPHPLAFSRLHPYIQANTYTCIATHTYIHTHTKRKSISKTFTYLLALREK